MKEEKFQVRCSPELKKKAKAYAKRNDTTMSRVTVDLWKNVLKGEKIRKSATRESSGE